MRAIRRYRTRRLTNLLAPAIQTHLSGLLLSPDRTHDQVLQKLFPSKSSRIVVVTSPLHQLPSCKRKLRVGDTHSEPAGTQDSQGTSARPEQPRLTRSRQADAA